MTPMTEKEFQTDVLRLAAMYQWRPYHTFDSRRSHGGFPDLVLVRDPRIIFAELKSENGKTSRPQREWLDALERVSDRIDHAVRVARAQTTDVAEAGVEVYLWRPRDLQLIATTLSYYAPDFVPSNG